MNIQLIQIEQLQKNGFPRVLRPQKSSEYEYVGISKPGKRMGSMFAKNVMTKVFHEE